MRPITARARIVWEFSASAVLQGVQVVALLIALVYWFVVNVNRGEENQRRMADLQLNVTLQITELRQTVSIEVANVRQQLNALADTRARLELADKRIVDAEVRYNNVDARLTAIERQMVAVRSDMSSITRASNVPLPVTRR